MAEDLVIDIGIPQNTEEFDSFVRCIENILEYGCGYDDDFTGEILEKCRESELDIAKQVVSELEKPRSKYRRRKGKLKWWEEYCPRRKSTNGRKRHRGRQSDQSDQRPNKDRRQRQTSPMFERSKNYQQKVHRKRPMSPMFDRPNSEVPEWPSRNKKRKFR